MGFYPINLVNQYLQPLNSASIRSLSATIVQDAVTIFKQCYSKLGVTAPQLNSSNEFEVQRYTHNPTKLNMYYYHPDHLGSSSYITNSIAKVIQHMEYLPFGETLVDEHSNSFNSPFKYNGKGLDEETGNYYYGARYYDPKMSNFISVDPLAEKTGDAYGYCYNNPVNLIDPTGMLATDPTELYNTKGKKIGEDANGNDGNVSIIQDSKTASDIESSYKKGGVATAADVSSGVFTTKTELKEALNVLKRGDGNGGLREESSVVGYSGNVYRGETGPMPVVTAGPNGTSMATATATLPTIPKAVNGRFTADGLIGEVGGTSIHLHPAGLLETAAGVFPFSALTPTPGVDDKAWSSNGYSTNIIVGPLGGAEGIGRTSSGTYYDNRDTGAAFYTNGNYTTPSLTITKSAMENIIK